MLAQAVVEKRLDGWYVKVLNHDVIRKQLVSKSGRFEVRDGDTVLYADDDLYRALYWKHRNEYAGKQYVVADTQSTARWKVVEPRITCTFGAKGKTAQEVAALVEDVKRSGAKFLFANADTVVFSDVCPDDRTAAAITDEMQHLAQKHGVKVVCYNGIKKAPNFLDNPKNPNYGKFILDRRYLPRAVLSKLPNGKFKGDGGGVYDSVDGVIYDTLRQALDAANIAKPMTGEAKSMKRRKYFRVGTKALVLKSDGDLDTATQEYLEARGLQPEEVEEEPEEFDAVAEAPVIENAVKHYHVKHKGMFVTKDGGMSSDEDEAESFDDVEEALSKAAECDGEVVRESATGEHVTGETAKSVDWEWWLNAVGRILVSIISPEAGNALSMSDMLSSMNKESSALEGLFRRGATPQDAARQIKPKIENDVKSKTVRKNDDVTSDVQAVVQQLGISGAKVIRAVGGINVRLQNAADAKKLGDKLRAQGWSVHPDGSTGIHLSEDINMSKHYHVKSKGLFVSKGDGMTDDVEMAKDYESMEEALTKAGEMEDGEVVEEALRRGSRYRVDDPSSDQHGKVGVAVTGGGVTRQGPTTRLRFADGKEELILDAKLTPAGADSHLETQHPELDKTIRAAYAQAAAARDMATEFKKATTARKMAQACTLMLEAANANKSLGKRVTKGFEDNGTNDNDPIGLRSLKRALKGLEEIAADNEYGPVKEALDKAIKLLKGCKSKAYGEEEEPVEMAKKKFLVKCKGKYVAKAEGFTDDVEQAKDFGDLKVATVKAEEMGGEVEESKSNKDEIKVGSRIIANNGDKATITAVHSYGVDVKFDNGEIIRGMGFGDVDQVLSKKKSADDDDGSIEEMKTDDPPHIQEVGDGYAVKTTEGETVATYPDKEDAIKHVKRLSYRKKFIEKRLSKADGDVVKDVSEFLDDAADASDTPKRLKGGMIHHSRALKDMMDRPMKNKVNEDELTESEQKELDEAMDGLEDKMKSFSGTWASVARNFSRG